MHNKSLKILTVSVLFACSMNTVQAERNPLDPYEGYNRFMFKVNDKVDRAVLKPVAKGYRFVTPKPVRKSVSNFFNNFRDMYSAGSNLLRGDIEKTSIDVMRVAINSTFGIFGIFDIAGEAQMPDNKNTLGDTFASWGWKNSNYFVYPLLGPSTVRDSIGTTIVFAAPAPSELYFHGKYDVYGAAAVSAVDKREQILDLTDSIDDAALDPYAYMRDAYMTIRNKQVGGTIPVEQTEDIDIDDLVTPETEQQPSQTGQTIEQPSSISEEHAQHNKTEEELSQAESVEQMQQFYAQENLDDSLINNSLEIESASSLTQEDILLTVYTN